jgi:hypothetical protein
MDDINASFKIFFEESFNKDEKVVLLKGDLSSFDCWKSLKDEIIKNSELPYFQSQSLTLKNNDQFILKLQKPYPNELSNISSIYNEFTFSHLISVFKEKLKGKNENVKLIFILKKVDEEPNQENEKYYNFLRKALNDTWKIEKENIKKDLKEAELTKSQMNFIYSNLSKNNKISEKKMQKNLKNYKKSIIVCNNCLSQNFYKFRYICSYCDNYNLCYKCYKKCEHNKQHNFIIINYTTKVLGDITKYDNKISPNYIELKGQKEAFNVQIKIANTGEVDLSKCFIGYIKFDRNYLICKKYEIQEKFEKNVIKDISLRIDFNDTDNIEITTFEGHFRMFNSYGIPFGDILKIKVINESIFKNDL